MAKLAVMIEGQEGVDWRLWKHLAETVEGLGFDSFWRSDHLYSVMGVYDRDTIECWTSLPMIATWTKRIPFGPNVSPMTFREPGVLARAAVAVDLLSEGRLVMGVGAGWYEAEHREFKVPFPSLKERMDRMDAAFDVMREVWETRNPRPVRGTIPFLVGGGGERRTLRAVARHASLWSMGYKMDVDEYARKSGVLDRHCQDVGRDPSEIRRGFQTPFLVGRTEEELLRRAEGLRAALPPYREAPPEQVLAGMRDRSFAGTPEEIAAQMRPYIDAGVDLFWMQHFLFEDDDALRLLMDEVAPLIA
ncbi:MAG TPA: LLM class flavin-dependent oxidoreductase [Candidatus Dormibacteraeota bacterium]|nr:LLM class flavin-dependent oxidoreductase [Candidatus Dormibacteraeota bacterium]